MTAVVELAAGTKGEYGSGLGLGLMLDPRELYPVLPADDDPESSRDRENLDVGTVSVC